MQGVPHLYLPISISRGDKTKNGPRMAIKMVQMTQ
jgi:hypothetical protein